jgi:uncharacterized protein
MTGMYAVQLAFENTPGDNTRLELRPAHRERLATLVSRDLLLAAGPWSDDSGALLIFRVDSREELDAIFAEDPYYSAPGVTFASIEQWNPVTRHEAIEGF